MSKEKELAPTQVITTFCPHCQMPTKHTTVPKDSFMDFKNFIQFIAELDVVVDVSQFHEDPATMFTDDYAGVEIEFTNGGIYTFYLDKEKDVMIVSKKESEE